MPLEEIIIGREPEDIEKYGKRGCIFLGKHLVRTNAEVHTTNPILMDAARPHCVLIVGKRGSGKSYSGAVIAEEIMNLPDEVKGNLAAIMIDTAGIFWSMKTPNDPALTLLAAWGLKPQGFPINTIVPVGLTEFYDKSGIAYDGTFSVRPSDLTPGDWCLTFGINMYEPLGILIERTIRKLAGKQFSIDDIVDTIDADQRADEKEKLALTNRFLAAQGWGIFSETATPIQKLLKPGTVTVLDVSIQEWNVRNLMLGILARELYEARVAARREEETALIAGEIEKKIPLTWLIIDECLPYESVVVTDKAHTPIGALAERFRKGERFKVLGYDSQNCGYGYYNVTDVFVKEERELMELITETGRKLRCTPEHKILTCKGFIPALIANEVAIPAVQHYSADERCVKARLLGSLLGDGWLNVRQPVVGFSGKGCEADLKKVKQDLEQLGFSSSKIYTRKTHSIITSVDGKKAVVNGTSQYIQVSTRAYKIFSELAAPKGEKVVTEFYIPKWLLAASKEEKAEFLAALLGADGQLPTPMRSAPGCFGPPRLYFYKAKELERCGIQYAKELRSLFKDLGINVSSIALRKGNLRKDGRQTVKFVITFSNKLENMIRFLENIGYRYNMQKELEANKILTYLKIKYQIIKQREQLCKAAHRLHREGLGKCRIAKRLKIPDYQVREWIYYNRRATIPHSFPHYSKWKAQYCNDNLIFERIINKEQIGIEPVYDIAVENVHNFVANGCIVHNCHNFIPAEGVTAATHDMLILITQGRQPGISTVFITQQPAKLHETAIAQADLVIAHRLTAKPDLDALGAIMQTYALEDIRKMISDLPKTKGSAVILDDNSERLFNIQVRPRQSWHAGGTPVALK